MNKKPQITHGYSPTLVSEFHGNLPKVVEVREDELSNSITTVQKDSLVVEKKQ